MGFEEVTDEVTDEVTVETTDEVTEEVMPDTVPEYEQAVENTIISSNDTDSGKEKKKKNGNGCAVASLILGILSCTVCMCIGLITGMAGFITSIVALSKKTKKKAMAIVGMITSILGMLLNIACIVVAVIMIMASVTATVAVGAAAVGALSNTEIGEIIMESIEEIDWDDPIGSFQEAITENAIEYVAGGALDSGIEAFLGNGGITVNDGNGNEYVFAGDSLQDVHITDMQSGEVFDLDDVSNMTGIDMDKFFDSNGNLDMEVMQEILDMFVDEFYGGY